MIRKDGIMKKIKAALIFLGYFLMSSQIYAQSALDDIRFSVDKYDIIGENPLGQQAYAVLAPFIGDQYGLEGLSAAADALEQALSKQGYSFHRVSLPPQELFSGSVILEIVQFRIGAIEVTGNKHFNADNIKRSIPALKEGEAPNTTQVSQSVKAANTNASKSIVLRFNEGEEPDTIDAELKVIDKNPQTYFMSLDNSGGHATEPVRMTLGYQHGNLFNLDHSMTLTVTTAPKDTDTATQFGVSYQIPFYEYASRLSFLVSDSESNTGEVGNNNLITGKGSVFGMTYSQSVFASSKVDQNWSIGITYKLFDNTLINTTTKVLSLPLELAYNFSHRGAKSIVSGGLSVSSNIQSGANNTDLAYKNARDNNATSSWQAVRYHLSYDYLFKQDWLLHIGLTGQSSGDSLISGEQFGVGGSASLRGFEERSINGDEGHNIRVELWMPSISQVRLLIFADSANIKLKESDALSNSGLDADVASVGLGLRWSWKQQLSLNADYGKITKEGGLDTTINRIDDKKAHVSLVYRF